MIPAYMSNAKKLALVAEYVEAARRKIRLALKASPAVKAKARAIADRNMADARRIHRTITKRNGAIFS